MTKEFRKHPADYMFLTGILTLLRLDIFLQENILQRNRQWP
ncbi:MAG: hypothetical protein AAB612_03235 [Patescibacteria group bacterium]